MDVHVVIHGCDMQPKPQANRQNGRKEGRKEGKRLAGGIALFGSYGGRLPWTLVMYVVCIYLSTCNAGV